MQSVKARVYSTANRPRYSGGEGRGGKVAHRRFWNPQYAKIAPMERIASAGQAIVERARVHIEPHKRIIARGWRVYARVDVDVWRAHPVREYIKEFLRVYIRR